MSRTLPLRVLGEIFVGAGAVVLVISTLLPWYELPTIPIQAIGRLQIPLPHQLTAWEAFDFADVLLAASAVAALVALWLERTYEQRWIYGLLALLGWATAAGILFAYFRPAAGDTGWPFAGPPGIGYFGGLCGCGGIVVGALLAAAAPTPERDSSP